LILAFDGIPTLTKKFLNIQILFDPLEESLYSPENSVEFADKCCGRSQVVCNKSLQLAISNEVYPSKTQVAIFIMARFDVDPNFLIF
jgi:hypothetical protein